MNNVSYLLEQVWLAHKEMGLGPLVQVELWIVAILVACWLVERVVRLAVRFARRTARALFFKEKVANRRLRTHTPSLHRPPASISACIAALMSVALLPATAMAQSGDMNCDGAVDVADIPLFVEALLNPGDFGGCDINRANMNADTLIDGRDTQPFVAALLAPPCPAGLTLCGGVCVDTSSDGNNCGGCQNGCGLGTCVGSTCIPCVPNTDPYSPCYCGPKHPNYPACN